MCEVAVPESDPSWLGSDLREPYTKPLIKLRDRKNITRRLFLRRVEKKRGLETSKTSKK